MSNRQNKYATFSSLGDNKEKSEEKSELKDKCIEIKSLEHKRHLLHNNDIVAIDLHARWCAPCKVFGPKFQKLAHDYNKVGRCLLVKEDVDLKIPSDYKVNSIPATIFYVKGRLLSHKDNKPHCVVGGNPVEVKNILDKLLQLKL